MHAFRATSYNLTIPGWPRLPQPLRVAFLSDFHIGSNRGDLPRLEAIVTEVSAHGPDLVLLGGDFVNMRPTGGERIAPASIARVLGRFSAPQGSFAVLGNHDWAYGSGNVARALRDDGIDVLESHSRSLVVADHTIDVIGLPYDRGSAGWRDIHTSLLSARPSIILTHDPIAFRDMPAGPHLMLAGHTHGGQIKFPGIGVIYNASRAPLRWSYGLIMERGQPLCVTSGIGTSMLPFRFGVPAEYVILHLNGEASPGSRSSASAQEIGARTNSQ